MQFRVHSTGTWARGLEPALASNLKRQEEVTATLRSSSVRATTEGEGCKATPSIMTAVTAELQARAAGMPKTCRPLPCAWHWGQACSHQSRLCRGVILAELQDNVVGSPRM